VRKLAKLCCFGCRNRRFGLTRFFQIQGVTRRLKQEVTTPQVGSYQNAQCHYLQHYSLDLRGLNLQISYEMIYIRCLSFCQIRVNVSWFSRLLCNNVICSKYIPSKGLMTDNFFQFVWKEIFVM
jgi:hypothetical protein